MPTVGWIREGDVDAFYEGTEQFPHPSTCREPTFSCPFCVSNFQTPFELCAHICSEHHVKRPLILLQGGEPTGNRVVRTQLQESDVAIVNTDFAKVSVNGSISRQVPMKDLPEILAKEKQAEVTLELVNNSQPNAAPVTSKYNFSFRVADLDALKNVEKAFVEVLVSAAISRDSIGKFIDDRRAQGLGKEYASGLAKYCLGILIKERPDGEMLTTPFSQYREHYGVALDVLKDFQRPLARLITSIIRFSMNDFNANRQRTGYWKLDLANELLVNPGSIELLPNHSEAKRHPVCPIDHGAERMLELASHLVGQLRWSPILDDECRALAHSDVLDVSDHQKVFAIWAAAAWRLGETQSALEPLEQIAEVYPFNRWAEEYLKKASS